MIPEDKAFCLSAVDVQAQTDIIVDPRSVPWIDRMVSIRPIHKIFRGALTRKWKKKMEPLRAVHEPWSEQTQEKQVEWEPDLTDQHTCPQGGSDTGPSAKMKEVVRTAKDLSPLFCCAAPVLLVDRILSHICICL